jgi:CubicO group peptidase (beta-lactamase class C family)
MTEEVLKPIGMTRSTFVLSDGEANLAEFFDGGGPATHYRFTATAAASLYTSVADLTHFIQAHRPGLNGEPPGRGVLSPRSIEEMRKPHAWQYGAVIWGLGTILYAENNAGGFIIGHDGNNAPAVNTAARMDPATGDGIVVLETGNPSLATRLAGEWIFWRTGNVDLLMLIIEAGKTLQILGAGWLVIVIAAALLAWRRRRRLPTAI